MTDFEQLKKLADTFFDWPTEDRTQVTLTSAILFAQHVIGAAPQQAAEPVGYLFEKVGCRAPDDCEEYREFVEAESVDPKELAEYDDDFGRCTYPGYQLPDDEFWPLVHEKIRELNGVKG